MRDEYDGTDYGYPEDEDIRAGYGYEDDDPDFADPGGESALRAATPSNPRNLPCGQCGEPNRLTPADRARGYCCDTCASRNDGTYRGADY